MSLFWFELYSLLSALVYASALVGVGWFLGENFHAGLKIFGAVSWLLFAAVVAVGIALWAAKRRRDKRVIAKNATAYEQEHQPQGERDTEPAGETPQERAPKSAGAVPVKRADDDE